MLCKPCASQPVQMCRRAQAASARSPARPATSCLTASACTPCSRCRPRPLAAACSVPPQPQLAAPSALLCSSRCVWAGSMTACPTGAGLAPLRHQPTVVPALSASPRLSAVAAQRWDAAAPVAWQLHLNCNTCKHAVSQRMSAVAPYRRGCCLHLHAAVRHSGAPAAVNIVRPHRDPSW